MYFYVNILLIIYICRDYTEMSVEFMFYEYKKNKIILGLDVLHFKQSNQIHNIAYTHTQRVELDS